MVKFDPTSFVAPKVKFLPVILLLDTSGSMKGVKIESLNCCVSEMLKTFCDNANLEVEIHVAIITFGADIKLYQALSNVDKINWIDMQASGATPLGTALQMAKAMIDDKEIVPSTACRPTVVLVSDGKPTDEWEQALNSFISSGRSAKCDRMAMAIGADADEYVLGKFIENTKNPLFYSENAKQLRDFFKFVTMSTVIRTKSSSPDVLPQVNLIDAKPATIEARLEKPKSLMQKKSDEHVDNGQPSEEGYW